ncbi:RNase P modulator RnpM [Ihubacter sp. rT4E-8]|uniref:RNase P modulator RnpM n=1 Tax=unclassified Ihubacter TaxID=2633299 RepID=UPI003C7C44E9
MKSKKFKIPMRRCIGCMESKPKQELYRIAFYEGQLSADLTGKAKGRGVYLCHDPQCFLKAKKKRAFQRNFESNIAEADIDRVYEELTAAEVRR